MWEHHGESQNPRQDVESSFRPAAMAEPEELVLDRKPVQLVRCARLSLFLSSAVISCFFRVRPFRVDPVDVLVRCYHAPYLNPHGKAG